MSMKKENLNIMPLTKVKHKKPIDPLGRATILEKFFMYSPVILLLLLILLPFSLVVVGSFTDPLLVTNYGVRLFPEAFSMSAYQLFFQFPEEIGKSYWVTIQVTLIGTLGSMFLALPCAYALSRKDFAYKNIISFIFFFTILFSGGYAPQYILMRNYLKIYDTIWALTLPPMMGVGYLFLLRAFYSGVPESLLEAARIDGASEWVTLFKVAIPLITPGIATVSFYLVLFYWNDPSHAMLYTENLVPISYYLTRLNNFIVYLRAVQSGAYAGIDLGNMQIPDSTLGLAAAVSATAPMLVIFTFFQKYFVKGITTGGVKG